MPYDSTPWRRRLEPLLDPFIALAVFVLTVLPLLQADQDCGCPPVRWPAYVLVLAQCAPLAVRRRHPFLAPMVTGLAVMAYTFTELPEPRVPYAVLVAIYTVAAYAQRRQATGAIIFAAAAVVVVYAVDWPNWDVEDLTTTVLLLSTAWLLGESTRSRHDRAVEAESRADQLERARMAESEAAVAAERNRIARELHDVVAHHVSMMVVQAEAGPVVVHSDPDRAAVTFDAISAAGKQALAEMRRLLGVLREDDTAPLAPQPALAALPVLVEGVRETGLDVRLDLDPDLVAALDARTGAEAVAGLSPSVELAAYRLVQEALTNCVRHAAATHAAVEVRVDGRNLVVRVSDDGIGGTVAPGVGGHGLVAMRERVHLADGTLSAGPSPQGAQGAQGGWQVEAEFPLSPVAMP